MSYLNGSFLGETEVMQSVDEGARQQALIYQQAQPVALADMITLPGGLVISKKTLLIVAAAVAVAVVIYLKKRGKE